MSRQTPAGSEPHPLGTWYTIEAVALQFGRAPQTIRNLLSAHRHHLDPPLFRAIYHPRDCRLYRIISQKDMDYLCALFPVSRVSRH